MLDIDQSNQYHMPMRSRSFRTIEVRMFSDPKWLKLSKDGSFAFYTLLLSPLHRSMIGVLNYSPLLAKQAKMTVEEFESALKELEAQQMIVRDLDTFEIWIKNSLRCNRRLRPVNGRGIINDLASMSSQNLRSQIVKYYSQPAIMEEMPSYFPKIMAEARGEKVEHQPVAEFQPPTMKEIDAYMLEILPSLESRAPEIKKLVRPKLEAPKFFTYWNDRKEWKQGGHFLKNWKRAVANWLLKSYEFAMERNRNAER